LGNICTSSTGHPEPVQVRLGHLFLLLAEVANGDVEGDEEEDSCLVLQKSDIGV
jgi:hypothetical protein